MVATKPSIKIIYYKKLATVWLHAGYSQQHSTSFTIITKRKSRTSWIWWQHSTVQWKLWSISDSEGTRGSCLLHQVHVLQTSGHPCSSWVWSLKLPLHSQVRYSRWWSLQSWWGLSQYPMPSGFYVTSGLTGILLKLLCVQFQIYSNERDW